MNQRIRVDKFKRAGNGKHGSDVRGKNASGFQAQNWPNTLAAGLHAVAHGAVDRRRLRTFPWHQPFEGCVHHHAIFFEKCREIHQEEVARAFACHAAG